MSKTACDQNNNRLVELKGRGRSGGGASLGPTVVVALGSLARQGPGICRGSQYEHRIAS